MTDGSVHRGAGNLDERDAPPEPIELFGAWREEARRTGEPQPDAMVLATAGKNARPSARVVMLRDATDEGLVFYTNYESRKGVELAENPWASVVLYWPRSDRQVRVEGPVERLPPEQSDAYFQGRPRESRIEAWASPQSRVVSSRSFLERRWKQRADRGSESERRPPWWGGYRLRPMVMEFWQQGPHRMHDRLLYSRQDGGGWTLERLAP